MATPDSTIPPKMCTKCGAPFPATREYFYSSKHHKDGLDSWCKSCKLEQNHRWCVENREKQRELSRRRYANKPEKERTRSRRRYAKRPEKERARSRRWQHKNPDKARTKTLNRRARKHAAEGAHTAEDIQRQYDCQKGHCYYCYRELTDVPHLPNSRTVDHIIPLKRGGRNSPDNLVIACLTCNSSKGDKLLHEWDGSNGRLL